MTRIRAEEAKTLVEGLAYSERSRVLVNLLWDVFGDVEEDGEEVLIPGRRPDMVDVQSMVTTLRQAFWPEEFPTGDSEDDAIDHDPDRVLDVLLLTDVDPTLEEVSAWTPEQRVEAFRWAAIEHLYANDNPHVERIPEPEHVKALPRQTIGGSPRCLFGE